MHNVKKFLIGTVMVFASLVVIKFIGKRVPAVDSLIS